MSLRRWLPLLAVLPLVAPARADVAVPYARFAELYRDPNTVHEPVWSDVRARPDAYRGYALCYQLIVRGRIDMGTETRLIGVTRKDEQITVACPGGTSAGTLGLWLGVIGRIPDDPTAGVLVAQAITQVQAPAVAKTTSASAAAPTAGEVAGGANGASGLTPSAAASGVTVTPVSPDGLTGVATDAIAPLPAQAAVTRPAQPQPQPQPQPQAQPKQDRRGWDAGAENRLERFIYSRNRRVGAGERQLMATEILRWSKYHGMRWEFFASVIAAESDFDKNCVSSAGAMGLGQLMPFNCVEYGVGDPFDIRQNLMGSAAHLRDFLDRYRDRDATTQFQLVLACYNAGPGAVAKYGGVPPYNETINYIRKIAGLYVRLCAESAAAGG